MGRRLTQSRVFSSNEGLASDDIRDLSYDAATNLLWVATSRGLTRVDLSMIWRDGIGLHDGDAAHSFKY